MPTGTKDHELSEAENATIDRCYFAFKVFGAYFAILNAWRILSQYGTPNKLSQEIDDFKRLGGVLIEAARDAYPIESPTSSGAADGAVTYQRLRPIVPFGQLDLDECVRKLSPGLTRRLEDLKNAEKTLADNNVCFDPGTRRIKCIGRREGRGAPKDAFNHIVGLICQDFVSKNPGKRDALSKADFRLALSNALGVFLDEPGLSDSSSSGRIGRAISNYLHR